MNVAYIRVSTAEQNEARQLKAMEPYNIERFFTEKLSGKDTNRPKLQEMLDFVREGDTVYVHDFSRLARSTKDLLALTELLTEKGVHLVSLKESIDTNTPTGKLMMTVVGAIAEFERQNILERQREGIAIAKERGVYRGRQRIALPKDFRYYYDLYMKRELSKSSMARELGVSRPTVDRFIAEYEKKHPAEAE